MPKEPKVKTLMLPTGTIDGRIFGLISRKTYKDALGKDREVVELGRPAHEAKLDADNIPSGCLMTDEEILSTPLHLQDDRVADVRAMWNDGQLATAIRTRRETEALTLAIAKERGIIPPVPASRMDFYTRLKSSIERALNEVENA